MKNRVLQIVKAALAEADGDLTRASEKLGQLQELQSRGWLTPKDDARLCLIDKARDALATYQTHRDDLQRCVEWVERQAD